MSSRSRVCEQDALKGFGEEWSSLFVMPEERECQTLTVAVACSFNQKYAHGELLAALGMETGMQDNSEQSFFHPAE